MTIAYRIVALGTLLALAGCAGGGGATCADPCTVAIVHLARLSSHLAIPLEADGNTVEALLDTGADGSTLTAAAATTLDARAMHNNDSSTVMVPPVVVSGVGGDTSGELLEISELRLAGGLLRDASVMAVPSMQLGDSRLVGLVGGDLLQNWDLDLDVGAGLLQLDRAQDAAPKPPWHEATTRVPFSSTSDRLIHIPVSLDGHQVEAIVDTGAPHTYVAAGAISGLPAVAGEREGVISGVSGISTGVRRHRFADLSIGGLSFGPLTADLGEGETGIDNADVVLGLDVLSLTRFYVAYQAHTLLIDEGAP